MQLQLPSLSFQNIVNYSALATGMFMTDIMIVIRRSAHRAKVAMRAAHIGRGSIYQHCNDDRLCIGLTWCETATSQYGACVHISSRFGSSCCGATIVCNATLLSFPSLNLATKAWILLELGCREGRARDGVAGVRQEVPQDGGAVHAGVAGGQQHWVRHQRARHRVQKVIWWVREELHGRTLMNALQRSVAG